MAEVTFIGGIASMRGKLGDTIFRKTVTGKTIAYKAPVLRYRKPTRNEIKQRNRFALVCRVVSLLLADSAQQRAYEKAFKKHNGGVRTLRQYVFKQVWDGLPR